MLEDTLEGLEDTEELEEAAQQEVDKVVVFAFSSGCYFCSFSWLTKFVPNQSRYYGKSLRDNWDKHQQPSQIPFLCLNQQELRPMMKKIWKKCSLVFKL